MQLVAICDVRIERREEIKRLAAKKYGNSDCWHAPLSISAAQHGKVVYCEKPCSMSMAGCRSAFKAAV